MHHKIIHCEHRVVGQSDNFRTSTPVDTTTTIPLLLGSRNAIERSRYPGNTNRNRDIAVPWCLYITTLENMFSALTIVLKYNRGICCTLFIMLCYKESNTISGFFFFLFWDLRVAKCSEVKEKPSEYWCNLKIAIIYLKFFKKKHLFIWTFSKKYKKINWR